MAIWTVDHTRGSIARNSLTNLVQDKRKLHRALPVSSLEIKLVSYGDGVHFPNGVSQLTVGSMSSFGNPGGTGGSAINYDSEIEFYWYEADTAAPPFTGSYGEFSPHIYNAYQPLVVTSVGTPVIAELIAENINSLVVQSYSEMYVTVTRRNWVRWSNIGSLDFTVGLDNVAGERPMDWSGLVYKIMKLGSKVIVYGEGGVSVLSPHDVSYGLTTVLSHGLRGRRAVAGNDFVHFFMDTLGCLYYFGESLEKLGYEEYLSRMTDPILSYDHVTKLLYLCDGTHGFVYSHNEKSLGEGPVNITGICYKGSEYYIASPGEIETPTFEIWTDIIDFGTRNAKTIHSIEVGTDLESELLVAAEFRMDKGGIFIRLPWVRTNPAGIASMICHGREFRIGVKAECYEYFEIDYIDIEGKIT